MAHRGVALQAVAPPAAGQVDRADRVAAAGDRAVVAPVALPDAVDLVDRYRLEATV